MRKAIEDKRRGIRLNFRAMLEDLDFADDIALLLSTFSDLQKMTRRLAEEAAREALNARKCKTLRTECTSSRKNIVVDGVEVDHVE